MDAAARRWKAGSARGLEPCILGSIFHMFSTFVENIYSCKIFILLYLTNIPFLISDNYVNLRRYSVCGASLADPTEMTEFSARAWTTREKEIPTPAAPPATRGETIVKKTLARNR